MHTSRKIPFSVNRNDARSLVDQVADGLRQAIVSGYWRAGDEIPSTRELVPLLGVSHIVTRAALSRLASEGHILTRVGLKPVVRDRGEKQWRGHVAFVQPDYDIGYFQTMFVETFRARLNEQGYLFTRATVGYDMVEGEHDFATLDAALSRAVDLAVILYDVPRVARHLTELGVPYIVVGEGKRIDPDAAAGLTRLDYGHAVSGFVESCLSTGVKRVVQLGFDLQMCDATSQLRAAGIEATTVKLSPARKPASLYDIEEAGRVGFTRIIESGPPPRDTAFFFADDYLTRGALAAMAESGLRAPYDIRLATWANAGLGPTYARELSRMEMNPLECGAVVANAALEFLENGHYPTDTVIGPKWFPGETL